MSDDKAVEAALDAWEEIDEGEWASDYGANRKSAMRAALAAADKVRAETPQDDRIDAIGLRLQAAFAAGLAKGRCEK